MTRIEDTPRDRFGKAFVLLARQWRQSVDAHLARTGLTDATWPPLMHLADSPAGLTQKALAARMGLDASTVVRLLDILGARGLVARHVDPADRRARRVVLTDAGRAALVSIRARVRAEEARMLEGIPDADLARVLEVFDRIAARTGAVGEDGPASGDGAGADPGAPARGGARG